MDELIKELIAERKELTSYLHLFTSSGKDTEQIINALRINGELIAKISTDTGE